MTKISTDSYKGVRDFYPKDMFIQNYIFDVMRAACESFGYSEYGASILEPSNLYKEKTSEEIVNEQTYTFTDRGDREVTLRPEMTPTVARMVAAKKREFQLPIRWYSIPNVFRYERPQKGRLREHWQLNADIFGVAHMEAELEIIALADSVMKGFGAGRDKYEIRINNRGELKTALLVDYPEEEAEKILSQMDKGNSKITVTNQLSETTKKLIDKLNERGISNVRYDNTLVRGFSYYTGIIFEVFDTSGENPRSLFGGGRYDNLMDLFDVESLPAVGFGMGDVTIRDFLETHNLLPEYISSTNVHIVTIDSEKIPFAQELGQKLRDGGLAVSVNISDRKIGDQIKYADKLSIPYVISIGDDEIDKEVFPLKNLETGEEKKLSAEEILEEL